MSKRIQELDIIKCFAMFMVVLGHSFSPDIIHRLVYVVHVPVFFLVSGYTLKADDYFNNRNNLVNFFKKRITGLYFPFLKFSFIIVSLHNVLYHIGVNSNIYSLCDYLKKFFSILLFSVGTDDSLILQLWYIKCLFLSEIFYSVMLYISNVLKINKLFFLLPIPIFLFSLNINIIPQVLVTNVVWPMRAVLLLLLGSYCRYIIQIPYVTVISLIGTFFWLFFVPVQVLSFQSASSYGFVYIVLFSLSLFVLIWKISALFKNVLVFRVFSYIGENTMPIYFGHIAAFAFLSLLYCSYVDDCEHFNVQLRSINYFVYVFFSFFICLFFNWIFDKLKHFISIC